MWITCDDGRKVNVGLAHTKLEIAGRPGFYKRRTVMWLQVPVTNPDDLRYYEEYIEYGPGDAFSKKEARQIVRNSFLNWFESEQRSDITHEVIGPSMKSLFNKNDRTQIYARLFPEYHFSHKGRKTNERKKAIRLNERLRGITKRFADTLDSLANKMPVGKEMCQQTSKKLREILVMDNKQEKAGC